MERDIKMRRIIIVKTLTGGDNIIDLAFVTWVMAPSRFGNEQVGVIQLGNVQLQCTVEAAHIAKAAMLATCELVDDAFIEKQTEHKKLLREKELLQNNSARSSMFRDNRDNRD